MGFFRFIPGVFQVLEFKRALHPRKITVSQAGEVDFQRVENSEWNFSESISENFPITAELSVVFCRRGRWVNLVGMWAGASSRCSLLSFRDCPQTDKESRSAAHDRTSFSAWFRHGKREAAQRRLFSAEFSGK